MLTAAWQSLARIGGIGGWLGTPYGLIALAKIAGFALLLGLAALNRFALTPRLAAGSRAGLSLSVIAEIGLGLGLVALGVALATTPPGAHVQPEWPFPLRPDLTTLADPHVRRHALRALWLAGAGALALLLLFVPRLRLLAPVVAIAAALLLPQPNLLLMTAPAQPSSFYRSETGYTATAIARGEEFLRRLCTPDCFRGYDDPADLSRYNPWGRSDGDFYGWLGTVFDRIGHSPFPHGTIAGLTPRERWQFVAYARAAASGAALSRSERWPFAVTVPDFRIICDDGRALRLRDLEGGFILLAAVSAEVPPLLPPPLPDGPAFTTLAVAAGPEAPQGADCHAAGADLWRAFALAGGMTPETLAGTTFIIDDALRLRSRIRAEDPLDPAAWAREIAEIAATPLLPGAAGGGAHH